MRILTLDVGNTTVDACRFEKDELEHLGRFPHEQLGRLAGEWDRVIVASVKRSLDPSIKELFGDRVTFVEVKDVPIGVSYKAKDKLGVDRVLFAFGVRELLFDSAILVSLGTATVIDLLLEGEFRGGLISLGVRAKLRCLSELAEGLPKVELQRRSAPLGLDTEECMLFGVLKETEAFVDHVKQLWSREFKRDLPVVISGGDAPLLREKFIYEPLIIHRALVRWLNWSLKRASEG